MINNTCVFAFPCPYSFRTFQLILTGNRTIPRPLERDPPEQARHVFVRVDMECGEHSRFDMSWPASKALQILNLELCTGGVPSGAREIYESLDHCGLFAAFPNSVANVTCTINQEVFMRFKGSWPEYREGLGPEGNGKDVDIEENFRKLQRSWGGSNRPKGWPHLFKFSMLLFLNITFSDTS